LGKNRRTLVTREDVHTRSTSEYEALIAIAKEARRLNAVPGLHLKAEENAIPKAVENFLGGRVEYEVDGVPASEIAEAEAEASAVKSGKGKSKSKKSKAGEKIGAKAAAGEKPKARKRRAPKK
jgi:hypothetical protein